MDIDTIVFDFNGTIINDRNLCLELLNQMLVNSNHTPVSLDQYLHVFTFPIRDYYIKAGFLLDEEIDDFVVLSHFFDSNYRQRFNQINIFPDLIPTLKKLKEAGKRLIILSASKQDTLLQQVDSLKITKYFDAIIGINDIYASSKIGAAQNYFSKIDFNPKKTLFVGDTLHDNEVAEVFKSHSILISRGHQAKEILSNSSCEKVFDNFSQMLDYIL